LFKEAVYRQRFDIESPVGKEPGLWAFVTSRRDWLLDRARCSAIGTIRDEVPMRMEEIPVAELLRNRDEPPITFGSDWPFGH
jgi:hypothetical protein